MGLKLRLAASLLVVLGVGLNSAFAAPSDGRISTAIQILSHTPTGNRLLRESEELWHVTTVDDLARFIKSGIASRTDAVLTRRFDPQNGQESRDRQVIVYLRDNQNLKDLVLDMAHELTHATHRPTWDPYDPTLTPGKYIWSAIEGQGGEVDAVVSECQVENELVSYFGVSKSRCSRSDRDSIKKEFYRVGEFEKEVSEKLGQEKVLFPLLSHDSPALYSSTGHAPYPIALLREFDELTRIACDNSKKRLERSPASLNFLGQTSGIQTSLGAQPDREFVLKRCH